MLFTAAFLALSARLEESPFERVQALLAERRFEEARAALPEIPEQELRARAETDLWYFARDFGAAAASADAGLAHAPEDLYLWNRALGAALWMRDGEGAARCAARMGEVLAAAELDAETRAWWLSTHAELSGQAEALVSSGAQRARCVTRARAVALSALGVLMLALVMLLQPARRVQG
jgi:hypothetical protein